MMEFLSWDDEIPNLYGKNKSHIPNHQPDVPDCPPQKNGTFEDFPRLLFDGGYMQQTWDYQQTNRGVRQSTKFQVFIRPTEGKHIFGFFFGYSMI